MRNAIGIVIGVVLGVAVYQSVQAIWTFVGHPDDWASFGIASIFLRPTMFDSWTTVDHAVALLGWILSGFASFLLLNGRLKVRSYVAASGAGLLPMLVGIAYLAERYHGSAFSLAVMASGIIGAGLAAIVSRLRSRTQGAVLSASAEGL